MQITCAVHVRASRPVRCDPWAIELLMPAMDKGNMSHDTLDASYAAHGRTMIRYHHDHASSPRAWHFHAQCSGCMGFPQNRGQLYSPLFPGPRSPRPLASTRGTTVCCTISEMGGCRLHGSPPQLVPDCPAMKYTLHSSQPWSPAGSLSWHQASTALSQ